MTLYMQLDLRPEEGGHALSIAKNIFTKCYRLLHILVYSNIQSYGHYIDCHLDREKLDMLTSSSYVLLIFLNLNERDTVIKYCP